MPPFAQLRSWLREGPLAEKVLAGVAVAIALGLVSLALVPVHNAGGGRVAIPAGGGSPGSSAGAIGTGGAATGGQPSSSAGTIGPSSGGTAPAGSANAASAGSTSATSGGVSGAPAHTSTATCQGLASGGPGVTATSVHVDIAYLDLAGPVGNAAFGIPANIPSINNAIVDYINKSGGVACGRKLVVTQYAVNPIDSNDEQSKCLQMVQDNVLMVINESAYVTPVSYECFVQNHLPLQNLTSVTRQQGTSSYPYLFGPLAFSDQQARNGILGLAARGFFKAPSYNGKLGLFEDGCDPATNQEIGKDLTASGVGSDQQSTYVLDCNLIAPPNQIAQAVLQNKLANDGEVFLASSIANNQNYVKIADQQNFHPRYLTSDYGSDEFPGQTWDAGFDQAVAITATRAGELDSGIHSPAEQTCNSILVSHGLTPITTGSSEQTASTCDMLFLLAEALGHAGVNPTRTSLVEDLGTMGTFHSAFLGDGVFGKPGQITGDSFQREIEYQVSCQCWKVIDPSFGPAY